MKLTATVLLMAMAAGSLWAQAPARKKAPASQAVAGEAAAPAQPARAASRPAAQAPAASPVEAPRHAGKRDPFVSPVVARMAGGPAAGCTTGKRCLVVDQTTLRGVVRTPSGWIAVVANQANKAYFLRENDPVFNGFVVKITGDSVVFRENVVDNMGRQSTREVVKKVNAPAV